MKTEELAKLLKTACEKAPRGDKVTTIHLFGIRYADEIQGHSPHYIAELAGIGKSYGAEISKGMRLSKFVSIR